MSWLSKRSEYRELIVDYKQTFSTDAGKRVLLDLMDQGWILNPIVGPDAPARDRAEGKRALVCEIMKKVNLNLRELDSLLKQQEEKTG